MTRETTVAFISDPHSWMLVLARVHVCGYVFLPPARAILASSTNLAFLNSTLIFLSFPARFLQSSTELLLRLPPLRLWLIDSLKTYLDSTELPPMSTDTAIFGLLDSADQIVLEVDGQGSNLNSHVPFGAAGSYQEHYTPRPFSPRFHAG
jgi:hypothetical protein